MTKKNIYLYDILNHQIYVWCYWLQHITKKRYTIDGPSKFWTQCLQPQDKTHNFRKTDVSHKTTRTVAMRQQVTTERIEMDGRVCGRPLYILKQWTLQRPFCFTNTNEFEQCQLKLKLHKQHYSAGRCLVGICINYCDASSIYLWMFFSFFLFFSSSILHKYLIKREPKSVL